MDSRRSTRSTRTTRSAVRTLAIAGAIAAVAFACGSGAESEFVDPNANQDEGGTTPPPAGTFTPVEAGAPDEEARADERLVRLRASVRALDVHGWAEGFLDALRASVAA